MAQSHEDLRDAAPVPATRSRNPFLRAAVLVPATAFALVGALAAGFLSYADRGTADGPGSTIATGPALTTRIGTADSQGTPQLLDRISLPPPPLPRPLPPARWCARTSSSTSAAGRPPRT